MVVKHFSSEKFNRIIFSIGCGSCEIEMQACDTDLVICLDKNRRSLSSAFFNSTTTSQKDRRKNLIISNYDMNDSIASTLEHVHESTKSKVLILFQHPSPAPDATNRQSLQSVGLDCANSVLSGAVQPIHFVFDHFEGRNCWKRTSLLAEFLKYPSLIKDCLYRKKRLCPKEKAKLLLILYLDWHLV